MHIIYLIYAKDIRLLKSCHNDLHTKKNVGQFAHNYSMFKLSYEEMP